MSGPNFVFLEYEPRRHGESRLRPFHHCRTIVVRESEIGFGWAGIPKLCRDSIGHVVDFWGSKDTPEFAVVGNEYYGGLPEDHWATFQGVTVLSVEPITRLGNCPFGSST
jgi:hypothetical protein